MGFFDTKTRKKRQTYKVVCEKLKDAKIIVDYNVHRIDASYSDNKSLLFTEIQIIRTIEPALVTSIGNETYGKSSELYLHTKHPGALFQAMKVAGIDMSKATVQAGRIILPVSFFKGYHWWE